MLCIDGGEIDAMRLQINTVRDNTEIIRRSNNWLNLAFLESLSIKEEQPELNSGIRSCKDLNLFWWVSDVNNIIYLTSIRNHCNILIKTAVCMNFDQSKDELTIRFEVQTNKVSIILLNHKSKNAIFRSCVPPLQNVLFWHFSIDFLANAPKCMLF